MVTTCTAFGCTERQKKGSNISFHRFPQDPEMKKKWVVALKRKNFCPTAASRICSKHFHKEYFFQQFGKLCLGKNAVPSIFDFPCHLQKRKVQCRTLVRSSTSINEILSSSNVLQNSQQNLEENTVEQNKPAHSGAKNK